MNITKTTIKSEPMSDYLASKALGNSLIHKSTKSLAHAFAEISGWGKTETKSTTLGTMFHEFLAQPKDFEENYVRWSKLDMPFPDSDLRKKANKEYVQGIKDQGIEIVDESQYVALNNMHDIIKMTYPKYYELIRSELAIIEHSIYATMEGEIQLKCRPDVLIDEGDHILSIDIKTAKDCHPDKLYYHCRDFGYLYSATYYPQLIESHFKKPVKHLYLFVESAPPHNAAMYNLESVAIDLATLEQNIKRLAKAIELQSFPGYVRKNEILEL